MEKHETLYQKHRTNIKLTYVMGVTTANELIMKESQPYNGPVGVGGA